MGDRRQILSFDALRAIAALLVMFSHVRDVFLTDWNPHFGFAAALFYTMTSFGHSAVIVFFVLSGFWITKVVVERVEAGTWRWTDYLLDRLARLWVVLLPALCLGAVADAISFKILHFPPPHFGANSIPEDVQTHWSVRWFFANAFFLQGLFAPAFGSNGPLWSLANEFWYYLWFPALYIAAATRRPSVPAVLAVGTAMVFRPFLPGFVCWLCGSLLYWATRRFGPLKAAWSIVAWVPLVLLFYLDRATGAPARDIALAIAAVLPFWRAKDWPLRRGPMAAYGASSSYSLYIVHYPLLFLAAAALGLRERLRPTAGAMAACLVIGAALILAGWAFSWLTERRTRAIRRWVAERASDLAAGVLPVFAARKVGIEGEPRQGA